MIRTYLDLGVLIEFERGPANPLVQRILLDMNRELVMSPFQELEVLPSIAPAKRDSFQLDLEKAAGDAIFFDDLAAAFETAMEVRSELARHSGDGCPAHSRCASDKLR